MPRKIMPKNSAREMSKLHGLKPSIAGKNAELQSHVRSLERERRRNLLQKSLELKERDYPKFVSKLSEVNASWLIDELRKHGFVRGTKFIKPYKYENLMQNLAGRIFELSAQRMKKK